MYISWDPRRMLEALFPLLLLILPLFAVSASLIVLGIKWKMKLNKMQGKGMQHVSPAPKDFDMVTEVVVVGAGILGSAMSCTLGRGNRKVIVVERDLSEPDRIVGELLQPGGYNALVKLGMKDAVVGIDSHIVHGYVIHDNESNSLVKLTYPKDEFGDTITGRSFHHGRFVMGLRRLMKQEENVSAIEGTVSCLFEDASGNIVGIEFKDKASGQLTKVKADLVIVADGCFSKFRKDLLTSSAVTVTSNFVGLVLHNAPQYSKGHAEIVLGETGPILIYQISSTCTRVLVDVPRKQPSDIKDYLENTTYPQLPDHLKEPFLEAINAGGIRSMPNSFLPSLPNLKPGVVILGDAMNMRHPLTGAGMSCALKDVTILSKELEAIPSFTDRESVQKALKEFHVKRKQSHSFVINILAQALYAVFASPTGHMNSVRKACFDYFKLGGRCTVDPVGLLSVLKPYPVVLIGHFFMVVFFAIFQQCKSCFPLRPDLALYKTLMILITGCALIFPLLFYEFESYILLLCF